MKKYFIYKHTNKINGKVYIGKTCQEPKIRYGSNGCGYKACPYFYSAIKKYGWNNFDHEILYSDLSLEEANEKEKECIILYDSTNKNKGYNIRSGGDGFDPNYSRLLWSNPEYAAHIKNEHIKRWQNSEYKKIMSEKMKEAWKDDDKRKRRSKVAKERWKNVDFRKKAQLAIKEACKTSVRCVETNETFDSIVDACKKYNIHSANILRSIREGGRSGGVHWERIDKTS